MWSFLAGSCLFALGLATIPDLCPKQQKVDFKSGADLAFKAGCANGSILYCPWNPPQCVRSYHVDMKEQLPLHHAGSIARCEGFWGYRLPEPRDADQNNQVKGMSAEVYHNANTDDDEKWVWIGAAEKNGTVKYLTDGATFTLPIHKLNEITSEYKPKVKPGKCLAIHQTFGVYAQLDCQTTLPSQCMLDAPYLKKVPPVTSSTATTPTSQTPTTTNGSSTTSRPPYPLPPNNKNGTCTIDPSCPCYLSSSSLINSNRCPDLTWRFNPQTFTCYKVFEGGEKCLSWAEAQTVCLNEKSKLVDTSSGVVKEIVNTIMAWDGKCKKETDFTPGKCKTGFGWAADGISVNGRTECGKIDRFTKYDQACKMHFAICSMPADANANCEKEEKC